MLEIVKIMFPSQLVLLLKLFDDSKCILSRASKNVYNFLCADLLNLNKLNERNFTSEHLLGPSM